MKSKIFFLNEIPPIKEIFLSISLNKRKNNEVNPNRSNSKLKQVLVFYDKKLEDSLLKWKENPQVLFYRLNSGEKTKSLEELPQHITKINSLLSDFDKKKTLFLAVGGGSLLDLVGFLASIYKRGVDFISLPSTWLSAIDSAHGGKNAINFRGVKNLLGTYHFPQAVFIVKELLKTNPKSLEESAYGELLKISLIEGGSFYKKLKTKVLYSPDFLTSYQKADQKNLSKNLYQTDSHSLDSLKRKGEENKSGRKKNSSIDFFPFLKPAIKAKMKIVKRDPFEKKSLRQKLNLGHSIGHVLEACQSLSHGHAVLEGLSFSLKWSFYKSYLKEKDFKEIQSLIPIHLKTKPISQSVFLNYLRQDKKHRLNQKLDFIFIQKPGKVFIELVSEEEILKEAQRQKLITPT